MSYPRIASVVRGLVLGACVLAAFSCAARPTFAQGGFGCGFFNRQVGGVSISPEGVLSDATPAELSALLADMKARVSAPADGLERATGLRFVSLRGLNAACEDAVKSGTPLPDDARYLSGLSRIQYIFVHPERNDIVLAGPGEGWRVDDRAAVVGAVTGRPMMQITDLLVALRTVGEARKHAISCSIDPTDEGRREFAAVLSRQRQFSPAVISALEKAMGKQQITLTGIPEDSHFAHVLVAADYRMKRLAMGLEKAPIAGLPSYLDMLRTKKGKLENATPRWWLACHYEPLLKSADGLSWELRGQGVKALTEDDFVDGIGGVRGAGKASPLAQEWADLLTAKYEELAGREPIFGELRNLMDMCVVAALLHKENLWEKSGCSAPALIDAGEFELGSWHVPKMVSTQCSFLKAGKEYIITASGGVQIESFAVASQSKVDAKVEKVRSGAPAPVEGRWWWQ